jgi:hypothetical protein
MATKEQRPAGFGAPPVGVEARQRRSDWTFLAFESEASGRWRASLLGGFSLRRVLMSTLTTAGKGSGLPRVLRQGAWF